MVLDSPSSCQPDPDRDLGRHLVPPDPGRTTHREPVDHRDTRGMNRSRTLERSTPATRARRYAALGDPARVAILERLGDGTRCLCEMQDDLGMAPNLLSYHMRILREAGLVSGVRRGRRIDYRIERDGFASLRDDLDRLAGTSIR